MCVSFLPALAMLILAFGLMATLVARKADHPWLRQLGDDLEALRALDQGDQFLALLDGGHLLRLWRDEEARAQFLSFDMAALRQAMLPRQVPPPGATSQAPLDTALRLDGLGEPQVGDFVCCLEGAERGVANGRAFFLPPQRYPRT